jgi:MFS family permease
VSEVGFLLLLPFLLKRLGVKWTLAVGMAAWALRYVCFAFGDSGSLFWLLLLVGLLLHGICYDFFFVAGQIYTNRFAGDRFRSSAQGLITLATYGVGILIGSLVSGPIVDSFATADGHQWRQIWIIPALIAAAVLVLFVLLFKDRTTPTAATLGLESEITTLEAPGASLPMPRERNLEGT